MFGDFMIDTGATLSVVSHQFYENIVRQPYLFASTTGVQTAVGGFVID